VVVDQVERPVLLVHVERVREHLELVAEGLRPGCHLQGRGEVGLGLGA
jgi:hypothetical protein